MWIVLLKGYSHAVPADHVSPADDAVDINFERPPVIEVALGVMYKPVSTGIVALSEVHRRWRDDYPLVEEHPALPPQSSSPGLILESGTPSVRLWLLDATRERLIQVQRDRFVVNWRRQSDNGDYPRYRSLSAELRARLYDYRELLKDLGLQELSPTAVEVTYVNLVNFRDEQPRVASLSDVLLTKSGWPSSLGSPLLDQVNARFDTTNKLGRPSSLVINAQSDRIGSLEGTAAIQVTSTAQVDDIEDVHTALDLAHVHAVQSFVDITSPLLHKYWGRTN